MLSVVMLIVVVPCYFESTTITHPFFKCKYNDSSAATLNIMAFNRMTFFVTTLNITIRVIATLSKITFSITQYERYSAFGFVMLSVVVQSALKLSVPFLLFPDRNYAVSLYELSLCRGYYAECHYAECHYAECHYAECHYAECHYAECHYTVGYDAEGHCES